MTGTHVCDSRHGGRSPVESQRSRRCVPAPKETNERAGGGFCLVGEGGGASDGRDGRATRGARASGRRDRRSVRDRRGAFGTAGGRSLRDRPRRRRRRRWREGKEGERAETGGETRAPGDARSRSRPSRRSGVSRGAALTSAPDHEHLAVIHAGGPAPQAHPPVVRPRAVAPSKLRRARLEPPRRVQPRRVELVGVEPGRARSLRLERGKPHPAGAPERQEREGRARVRWERRTRGARQFHDNNPKISHPAARPPIRGKREPVESRNKPTIDRLN